MDNSLDRFIALHKKQQHAIYEDNHVTLLKDGEQTYSAMFEKIQLAEKQILLESYIFEDEGFGETLRECLIKKSQEGCRVIVIYDSAGSFETDQEHFQQLEDAGVKLCEYNPIKLPSLRSFRRMHHRNHRKILVIDDQFAFTGGINISKVYGSGSKTGAKKSTEDQENWRDTHVLIEGPAVSAFAKLIEGTLQRQDKDFSLETPLADKLNIQGDMQISVVDSVGETHKNPIQHLMINAFHEAQDCIFITNAYFSPGRAIIRALKSAAKRGLNVHLLLPKESDWTILRYASESHFTSLLKAGVHIHRYDDGMLHAKTIMIDHVWSTVGSTNLDYRSLMYNDEANAIILSQDFAETLEKMFIDDLSRAEKLVLSEWKKRGLKQRTGEVIARSVKKWL